MLDGLLRSCRAGRGLLLAGAAGVGKSRLLRELTSRLSPDAWAVERFVATDATRLVPFGPMISLLGDRPADTLPALLAGMRAGVLERARGRPVAFAVDDAHLLDEASLALLTDLASQEEAVVLLTARLGDEMPPALTALWAGAIVDRVEVDALEPADTMALAAAFLGEPVEPTLLDELTRLSDGNPLLLRELLADARWSRAIGLDDGCWRRLAPLRTGPRLQELVMTQVHRLSGAEAAVLELLAVGEPLDVLLLGPDEGRHLDHLERQGLALVDHTDGGLTARTHHPLIAEAMRAALPTRRRIALLRDLAARVSGATDARHGDALRAARWWMAAGDDPPAATAAAAAREALGAFDLPLAAELATLAVAAGESCERVLTLGDVRRLEGRPDDAEAALARAAELAETDEQRHRVATLRSYIRVHQMGQPAAALELLEAAAAELTDPGLALGLHTLALNFSGMFGRYRDVLRMTRRILAVEDLDDDATWSALLNAVYAEVMLADLIDVDDHLERALALEGIVVAATPELIDLLWALRAGAFIQRGELVRGERIVAERLARCRADDAIHGVTATIFLQLLLHRASPLLPEALEEVWPELDRRDPFGVRPMALGTAALVHALCGRADAATAALEGVDSELGDPRARPFVARGRAALMAASGDVDGAVELVVDRGLEAVASTHVAFGAVTLHDAVRYGRPELVAEDLLRAVSDSEASLLRALAAHAAAARDRDGKALDLVGTDLAAMNAPFLAAAAWADAVTSHRSPSAARRSAARAAVWSAAAAPFLPPPLELSVEGVSPRQLEIALRATTGSTSREIADELYVSVRTVDNHLRSVYGKLDVGGRAELAEVLAPLPAGPAGESQFE